MPKLTDIPISKIYNAQQSALMRLQLWFVGETHRLLSNATEAMKVIIFEQGGEGGELDTTSAFMAQTAMLKAWDDEFFDPWTTAFVKVREEAAILPFGALAVMHDSVFAPLASPQLEERQIVGKVLVEGLGGGVFEPQLQAVVDAASTKIYGDGLQLSSRIWRIDREAREGIQRVLMAGIVDKKSAWDIAKSLEQYLGADASCTRWTSSRLYGLTKTQIAQGNKTGLVTGSSCSGKGVSADALRLARTEIQSIHHAANDAMMASIPWVDEEQIVLSAAHPKRDICDDVVEKNGGVYPKGTITLPLHPNCMCGKKILVPDMETFGADVKAWMRGEKDWAAMDEYDRMVGGVGSNLIASSVAVILEKWLFGEAGIDE